MSVKQCVTKNYAFRSLIQALSGVQILIVFFQLPYRYLLMTTDDFRKSSKIFENFRYVDTHVYINIYDSERNERKLKKSVDIEISVSTDYGNLNYAKNIILTSLI